MLRVVVTGDFHGNAPPPIPPCDLLLYAGDIGRTGHQDTYENWLASLPCLAVGIAGNHDYETDRFRAWPWVYLENEAARVKFPDGRSLLVWGSPFTVEFMGWAHMRPDRELAAIWATIPADVDVILVHGPPYGHLDYVERETHAGSRTLRDRIDSGAFPRLRLVACGHLHEGYGTTVAGGVIYANGSHVDARYRPVNPPLLIDLPEL